MVPDTRKGPFRGLFAWWRWGGSNPRPRHAEGRLFHRLGPLLMPPGGERTSRPGRLPPWSRPSLGGVGKVQPVPPLGRPRSPSGWFNESATWRSRVLARAQTDWVSGKSPSPGQFRRRGPVRSYRWQFGLGGLIRGPAVQPPPAPVTWIHDLSKPVTPKGRNPGPSSPGSISIGPGGPGSTSFVGTGGSGTRSARENDL